MSTLTLSATAIEKTAFKILTRLELKRERSERFVVTETGPLYAIELSGDVPLNHEALEYLHRTGRLPWYRYIEEQRLLLASLS